MKFIKITKAEQTNNFSIGDRVFYDPFYEFVDGEEGSFYDSGILKEIKHWPYNNREYYMVELENGDVVEIGTIFHTEEEKDAFRNNWMNPSFEKESKKKDKEYIIHYRSEKEQDNDLDFHTYKILKDKKHAIELAKDLFKKMNYKGEVNVDSGDYNYYSTDNYDWDKINKTNSKDYKNGYRDGKDAYEIGHPADPDDLNDDFTEEYIEGYWQGFYDAQEKEFYKQSAIQPTQPKPQTELPNDMVWAWSNEMNQWIAVKKDDTYNVANTNNTSNQQTLNYTTARIEKVLASMIDKEVKRSEIDNDYFNCIFASNLIRLSGIDFKNNEPKFKITKSGLKFLENYSLKELDKNI